ncbi:alpha/beta fold hydrolase [Agromyces sp. Marseille-P2726]|uniref:alpha/beta fold hydrolase n=1 Tax=Agromyces sp. Marseille-P2726 TaxID=2709132 RepID=UPI001C2DC4ED|nr:alpha/beta hydrolase [Agromyces sp. Marseille-P2726]
MTAVAGAVIALSGCAASPDGPADDTTTSASSQPPSPELDVAGTFDIGGGRQMYLQCSGTGTPTVLFVSGQRASADDWLITADGVDSAPVFSLVAEQTRVCSYDRPGTPVGDSPSRSDPVQQPATAAAMVDDLHALLAAAEIAEPVVLVAHSAGGLAARLYASTYPDEVAGMVLVDALSEGLQDAMTPEQWQIQIPLLRGDIDAAIAEYPPLEWVDADTSFDQLRAAPPVSPMPLIVLTSDEPIGPTIPALKAAGVIGDEIPDDFGYVTDAARAKSQARLAQLVPGAVHITKTDSGHNVHYEQPALVAEAVVTVVDLVREGADSAGG